MFRHSESLPHPIDSLDCDQLLAGRARAVPYATASIDTSTREISVLVDMNYRPPSLQRRLLRLSKHLSDECLVRYASLADAGLAAYWSRTIELNGEDYAVNVSATRSASGLPLMLSQPGSPIFGPLSSRSSNPYPILVGNVYYEAACGADADRMFAMTAAHEMGHAFLTSAFGIRWSWGHQGTSSVLGQLAAGVAPYPSSGEIGLMTYYRQNPAAPVYREDVLRRTLASENDVKTLLYIAGRG